jgi:hypothetical protein
MLSLQRLHTYTGRRPSVDDQAPHDYLSRMTTLSFVLHPRLARVALITAVFTACSGRPPSIEYPDAGAETGGASSATGGSNTGGSNTTVGGTAASGGNTSGGTHSHGSIIEQGEATVRRTTRPDFGALVVVNVGERSYVVESRRDVEPGPLGLPWRSRFRVAAYDAGQFAWAYAAEPDDLIGDVVVHPSGEVTLSIERQAPAAMAYELVRLTASGAPVSTTILPRPVTTPATDFASSDPQPLFRMKSDMADATSAGWVRLLADGDGLTVAFLSYVGDSNDSHKALGLARYAWQNGSYVERWARVVEGAHGAEPAAWAYDELRWREQAVRPLLARDEATGELVVGRAWNQSRCRANRVTFAEFTSDECVVGAVSTAENELLPLAVTRFDASGARLGTVILRPELDAAEQIAFALAANQGQLATVGAIVRTLSDGSKRTYPDPDGFVDYDGYVGVYDANGHRQNMRDVNFGRGDVLANLRWLPNGIVAVGSVGWDRWQGGMSISKGADPAFVWFPSDGSAPSVRSLALSDGARHFNLHDVVVLDQDIIGYGFSDAPMTHSADGNNTAARTFGSLQVRLAAP